MNDFDAVLEIRLRHLLDPVVASRPPRRGRASRTRRPTLTVQPGGLQLSPEPILVVEPVAVAVSVAASRQL
jgi:hypothetical protein